MEPKEGHATFVTTVDSAGRQDVFFELMLSPWDYAAGALLVEEAGGVFVMPRLNAPDFARSEGVIAASPACYEEVAAILRPYW